MKHRLLVLVLALSAAGMTAQKKELKIAEKAFKKKDFQATLVQLEKTAPLLADAAPKLKEKYYYLKAASLYAEGTLPDQEAQAGKAFLELLAFEKKSGTDKYRAKAGLAINQIVQRSATQGSDLYKSKDYKAAAEKFELVYSLSKRDTSYLENAAMASYFAKEYDRSIALYKELLRIGYTGIYTQYKALSTANGEAVFFDSKSAMDQQVKLKLCASPEVVISQSRTGEIAKNIAFSYIAKGEQDAALKAIEDAKKIYPNDYTLIISEANIYFKLGNKQKFLELLKKAIELKPEDPQLHYNVGVLTLEQGYDEEAIEHFKEAIRLQPDHADAYNNIGVAILEKEKPIVEEMNNNLSDFDKYDALMLKQKKVYREALPYYEKALEYSPKSEGIMKTLIGLYELLGLYKQQKATQATLDAL